MDPGFSHSYLPVAVDKHLLLCVCVGGGGGGGGGGSAYITAIPIVFGD